MKKHTEIRLSFWFMLLAVVGGRTQTSESPNSDSLVGKGYDYLKQRSFETLEEPEKAEVYVKAMLKLGKKQKNDTITLRSYYYHALMSDFENSISYYDSIIYFGEKEKRSDKFLPLAYLQKGYLYYDIGDSKKCLDNYLMARETAKRLGYDDISFMATWSVGIFKDLMGQEKEALEIYKELYTEISKDGLNENNQYNYFGVLSALSDTYTSNGKLDSATAYNKLGVKNALKFDNKTFYPQFVLNEGVNLYEKHSYDTASDSLTLAIDLLTEAGDSMSLVMALLYKSKAKGQKSGSDNSNYLLRRADSIISRQERTHPEFAMVYEELYSNYKKTDSVKSQLHYLEKLIDYNKKVEEEFKGLDATIYQQYDTPELVLAKEEIIKGLEEKNNTNKRNIYLLSIFLACLCILSFYYYRKRVVYKKRYELLLQKDFNSETPVEKDKVIKKTAKIPQDVLAQLLPKIEEFEKNKGYLDSSITLNKMAKLLGSNSNYLSKTINYSKNKNFSSYLSDLRIKYAIEALKTDSKLLNYTVKAIASEVGFGNTESFTKAFYAKTDIYPSYFIKQLKKGQ